MQLIDGKSIAATIQTEMAEEVKQFIAKNGVNERKIDDLTKMKKEINLILGITNKNSN